MGQRQGKSEQFSSVKRALASSGRRRTTIAALLLLCLVFVAVRVQWKRPVATAQEPAAERATPASDTGSGSDTGSDAAEPPAADVVIVGAGISGLSAALELARGGARVTVLDMSSVYGGHAVMSQGGVCIVNSRLQRSLGLKDSPQRAYRDFLAWGEDADPAWVRYYCERSSRDIYDWLRELGVGFENKVYDTPGSSVPRFHQPLGRGIGLVTPIYRACLEQTNIRFQWNVKAEKLLQKGARVVGVGGRDMRSGTRRAFRASAVVLATGGFQSNLDMVRTFWPKQFPTPKRILAGSGLNSVGSGHRLAQSVGGALVKMDHQWNYFTGIPDPRRPDSHRGLSAANLFGILVNKEGKRFANQLAWAKEVVPAMLRQTDQTMWWIFDEKRKAEFTVSGSDWADFAKVDKLILQNPKLVKKAKTLRELARKTGLPPTALEATVKRYNRLYAEGTDTDFGRFAPNDEYGNKYSDSIDKPPYYAMQSFLLTRKSMGGVAIDRGCRVLDKQKRPIRGLYAVGELTGLAGINGKAALEGTFLGPCILTGRVAGRTILTALPGPRVPRSDESTSCMDCHDTQPKRKRGYWHFDKVHGVARTRMYDCRQCHAELAPYREQHHRTNPQALAASCILCHVGRE